MSVSLLSTHRTDQWGNTSTTLKLTSLSLSPTVTQQHQTISKIASAERQAEETRIRRILQLNSYQLVTLERYLLQEGHIPDSADEEAARDATYKIYEFSKTPAVKYTPIHCLFDPHWPNS
jgi:DNA-binding protein H-NS